jgi:hypothetical protein
MWQQFDDGTLRLWCDALDYCETLDLGGETDWRLPNVHELQSLVHQGRYDPAIDPIFGTLSGAVGQVSYWTSTSQQGTLAWHYLSEVGFFQTGTVAAQKALASRLVRAGRNAP